jgi:tripartite-type tricarboxylate transporter receptor subunit TctC
VKFPRRQFLHLAAGAAALPAVSRFAWAQTYPSRPVRMIVPFGPGGPTDAATRLLAQKLSEHFGQQFYVENVPGASANIGTGQAARSAPDGHTILVTVNNYVINPSLFKTIPYDPYKDFASPGLGTPSHLLGEQFRVSLGLDLLHVPFNGSGPAMASVVGGHTPISFGAVASAEPQVKDGRLRALAILSKRRSRGLPDAPTMAEAGYPEVEGDGWVGVLVPARTPKEIVAALNREIARIIALSDTTERLAALGLDPVGTTPEEFATLIKVESEKWAKVIQAANINIKAQ